MKTPTLIRLSLGTFAGVLFATAAVAGPGPQSWNRTPSKPAATALSAKLPGHAMTAGAGCKAAPVWVVSDRGPAGKGLPGARIAGYTPACPTCFGYAQGDRRAPKAPIQHAPGCATLACCP